MKGTRAGRLALLVAGTLVVTAACVADGSRGAGLPVAVSSVEAPSASPVDAALTGSPAAAVPATALPASAVPATASPSVPSAAGLQAILVSRSLWPGRNRLLIVLEDGSNAPAGGPDLHVTVSVGGSAASVPATFERETAGGRGLYAADVMLPGPGDVGIVVTATAFGVPHTATTTARVRDPGRTPAVGAAAPRVDTPTFSSAGGDLARVTTDPVPDRRLYWLSARQALVLGRPFVLVLDSYALRPSPACGGALGIVHHLADEFPSVSFIHVEAWATRWNGTGLVSDPIAGPLRPAPWTAAWGVTTAPWIFVVDGTGTVRAKFAGIVGTDELRAAIRSIAAWAPTY